MISKSKVKSHSVNGRRRTIMMKALSASMSAINFSCQRFVPLALLILSVSTTCCHAFCVGAFLPQHYRMQPASRPKSLALVPRDGIRSSSSDGDSNEDEGDDSSSSINLEEQRRKLESLLLGTNDYSSEEEDSLLSLPISEWKKQLKNPPPLTAIGRERMETEISLLESLANSDEAIP